MLYQHVIEGTIAGDPRVGATRSGTTYLTFRLLHNDRYWDKSAGEWISRKPVGIDVIAFGRLADNTTGLNRGDTVIVGLRADLRVVNTNGFATMSATAESIAVSARWHPATSAREPKRAAPSVDTDQIVTADGELIST